MTVLADMLRPVLESALRDATRDRPSDADQADAAVADRVLDRIGHDPGLMHIANAEPWYRSRVTLGALVSAATPLAALAVGREITADEQATLLALLTVAGTLLGSAMTLYGRWVARRPIGR